MFEEYSRTMTRQKLITVLSLFAGLMAYVTPDASADNVKVYSRIPESGITAAASSSIPSSPASNVVNRSGMTEGGHVANNLGEGMWVSEPSGAPVRFAPGTHEGAVWFVCEFDAPQIVDQVRIWNHNQNEHTRRGLNKVYIEWSKDGNVWNLVKDGSNDFHIIPESVGRNPEPADYVLDLKAADMKFLCITAATEGGNHYDMNNPVIRLETSDMRQNPAYFGLAEIAFYRSGNLKTAELEKLTSCKVIPSQGYLKTPDGPRREFRVVLDTPVYAGAELKFTNCGKTWSVRIPADPAGVGEISSLFPAGYMDEESELIVDIDSRQGSLKVRTAVPAARKWTVNFFPHSHLDIGYTHRQKDVMRLQWRNFERAMDLAERTKDYPEGAQYRWNSEATWPLAGYLEEYAGTEKADRIIKAVKDGIINVDAGLGSILTGISRQEELMHIFDDGHKIEELTGVRLNTAMMSDVPGQVWGFATALAQNGVKYFSPGPNYVPFYGRIGNDRAAAIHVKWGDHPFWWQSQSGTDKVLVWSAGRGYSWFHGWLAGRLSVCGLDPIWQYLEELENEEFPYNTCYLRYTVHGDNGPPDEMMPDVIREWNEKYDSPQFRISTSKEFFEAFEQEYGDRLPVYAGDMTPTWEDGAASTANETMMNREASARLAEAQKLWSVFRSPEEYPAEAFARAWKNVVLFSEHTWGAAGSGPEPFSKFTIDLWNGKKMYADSADAQSSRLHDAVLSAFAGEGMNVKVINSNLWDRTDAVYFGGLPEGYVMIDDRGENVPFQRMADGRIAFIAVKVPAMSSRTYSFVKPGRHYAPGTMPLMAEGNVIDNGLVRVVINPESGTISSFRMSGDDFEYAGENGLNDYLYTARRAADPRGCGVVRSVEIIDNGPVAATIRVVSDAPGCNSLTRDVTVYRGIARADIANTLDKQDITDFENVRFVFPFNFPHPDITMDLAMSEVHPEREQLEGVNKHYYSLQNGLSVGDLEHGLCLLSPDAPFVELGTPSGEDYRLNPHHGYGWWPMAQLSPKILSWVMTNTWRTNYKASQGGISTFRYSLIPGNPLDLKLKQHGVEMEHRMTVVRTMDAGTSEKVFGMKGNGRLSLSTMTPAADGTGYVVAIQNLGRQPVHTGFVWGTLKGTEAATCSWDESPETPIDPEDFWLKPYEYVRIKIKADPICGK